MVCEVNILQENDNKDSDKRKNVSEVKTKISSVVAAVCVTVVLSAGAAAFFINRAGNTQNEQIKVYYESQGSSAETSTVSRRVSGSVQTTVYAKTSRKTITSKTSSAKSAAVQKTEIVYSFPADINLVTAEQLIQIDGVGEVTAQKIIGFRSGVGVICNMDQLLEIDGIGEATLNKLKEYLFVSDRDYAELTQPEEQTEYREPEETEQTRQEESKTVTAETKTEEKTSPTTAEAAEQMRTVNINTASAEELSESLLIETELAEAIVELRTNIKYFVNDLELLYVDGFTEKMLVERRPFITL